MENTNRQKFRPDPKLKLMDQVRQVLRYHHYAYRTEHSDCDWILRYIKFHGGNTHPAKMGKKEIAAFLSYLVTHLHVAAATLRQALNAIVFLSKSLSVDPRSKVKRRHHVLESGLQKAVKTAVDRAGITKCVSCHTFRHSFATPVLENGVNIRVVQELMGHADVKTTEIYTHVMEKDISAVLSPLDRLAPPEDL
jgi:site-specific recombinase XerD